MEENDTFIEIPLQPVNSSQIAAIGYDAASSTLRVKFHGSGSTYDYAGVPADVHRDFLEAESAGRFFGAKVKGAFEYRKLPAQK